MLALVLTSALLAACGGGASSAAKPLEATVSDAGATVVSTAEATASSAAPSASAAASTAAAAAPASAASPPTVASFIDRLDFGTSASERAHALNAASTTAAASSGAFGQTSRQPMLKQFGVVPDPSDTLAFTMAVDPVKQNYLTVKLWGSDGIFGVLHLQGLASTDGEQVFDQLDNDLSNGPGNPPFYGRFHYATTTLPMSMTVGKTSVSLALYATGDYYDSGQSRVGQPTRPVYAAFTHTDPYFVPPAADVVGAAPVQAGTAPPAAIDKATVYRVLKRSRANMYNLDGVPDGFWNPGGTLVHSASVIAPGTTGAPPEVIGMHLGDGPVTASQIAALDAQANPADAWRNAVVGRQTTAISIVATAYLTPPLNDVDGHTVAGYDRHLDPAMLDRLIGLLDGQARSQGGGPTGLVGWDQSCTSGGWGGVTSTPRTSGPWAGSKTRQNGGCISFAASWSVVGRTVLRLLDDPQAATAFQAKLTEQIDADLDGHLITRAAMYERMLGSSAGAMGFGLNALTSANDFDKFGGTAAQAMIFVGEAYPAQLAERSLLALFPSADADKQPIAPATMRIIVRQLLGLDDMVFMAPATPGWRIITRGGLSETYGSLACGYDGRYGGGIVPYVASFALLTGYDAAMSTADRQQADDVVRHMIAAFDNFLYPQHQISIQSDGSVTDTYALGQDDVISWRVPYGPNANGWNLNLQTLSVDPNGAIQSPLARRSFLLNAARSGADALIGDMTDYTANEAAWLSIAGVDPSTVPRLPGEPGAADFVWADVDSGALALQYHGERLFFNANYDRGKGLVNQTARIHHVTDLIDREATVRMPFNDATVQADGNLSGGIDGAWVVRFGRYLAVMNRSATAATVKLPAASGAVVRLRVGDSVQSGTTTSVAAGAYEVFILP